MTKINDLLLHDTCKNQTSEGTKICKKKYFLWQYDPEVYNPQSYCEKIKRVWTK
jgi:hypothetical protein